MTRGWAVANGLWALLFAFCAVVQLNDPDRWLWIAAYGIPATVCVASFRWRLHPTIPGIIGGLWGVWVVSLWLVGIDEPHPMAGFPQFGILGEELVREGLGLSLVAFWMAVLAVRGSLSGTSG